MAYIQSSCDCYKKHTSSNEQKSSTTDIPTNMSVANCKIPDRFKVFNTDVLQTKVLPAINSGYKNLNPNTVTDKFSNDFYPVQNDIDKNNNMEKIIYHSTDPRLISAAHSGQVLKLDRPALDSSIKLSSLLTDKSLNGYGQNYRSYADVNAGYINYYTDNSIQDSFFIPNFSIPSISTQYLYQDPMGAIKPQYYRQPIKNNNVLGNNKNYNGGLSWLNDTMEHREDIMSKQMSVRNQQRWEPRWS